MQQYGPQNPDAPAQRRAPSILSNTFSFFEQEAKRTGRSVEELEALIRGSQAPPPVAPAFLRSNPGPSIGADHYAEGLERRGFSDGQINRAMRSRADNMMQYGSANPSFGARMFANTARADQLHGGVGLLQGTQDALMTAGPSAVGSVLGPVVRNSRPLMAAKTAVDTNKYAGPVVRNANSLATTLNPSFTRGVASRTPGAIVGSIANKGIMSPVLDGVHQAVHGDKNKDDRRLMSAANKFGLINGGASRLLPLLTGFAR